MSCWTFSTLYHRSPCQPKPTAGVHSAALTLATLPFPIKADTVWTHQGHLPLPSGLLSVSRLCITQPSCLHQRTVAEQVCIKDRQTVKTNTLLRTAGKGWQRRLEEKLRRSKALSNNSKEAQLQRRDKVEI